MMKKVIVFFTYFLIMILGLSTATELNKEKEKIILNASWGEGYEDIKEITLASDMIAMIKVVSVAETGMEQQLPYTIYNATVMQGVYNAEDGQDILIYMTGGETEEAIFEIADCPLLKIGEEVLLFGQGGPDPNIYGMKGPDGRLILENGTLSSLSAINKESRSVDSNAMVDHVDAEQLIETIKGYLE